MRELLIPGRECLFEYHPGKQRKTACTLAAVDYNGTIIPLFAAGANHIARHLLLPLFFPYAMEIIPEFSHGGSRFDFLVKSPGKNTLVEVKSCSLVEEETAMFPDAPTTRGTRHIRELAATAKTGSHSAMVLFVIVNPSARRLVPNIHTDPDFSAAVIESRDNIDFRAASIDCTPDGNVSIADPEISIDTGPCVAAQADSGVYLLAVKLENRHSIETGALGKIVFEKGTWLYVGSSRKNLSRRVARHLRRRKNLHWHIDYLVQEADSLEAFPIRSTKNDLECRLAEDISHIAESWVDGFGSSDCRCKSHLFRLGKSGEKALLPLLLHYRHTIAL